MLKNKNVLHDYQIKYNVILVEILWDFIWRFLYKTNNIVQ